MDGLRTALAFLTAIPVGSGAAAMREPGRAAAWFPVVGLVIGACLVLVHAAASAVLAPGLAAVATVATWALLTGGLHLDGLADCGDGLLVAASTERRLEIMRDPRLGTFGGVTLVLHLAAKLAAVAVLPVPAVVVLLLAPSLARWLLLLVAVALPPARPGGMGEAFRAALGRRALVVGAVVPLVVAATGAWAGLAAGSLAGLVAAVGSILVALGVAALVGTIARRRLGGVTGDVLGLVVETTELAVLVTYPAVAVLAALPA
jgi:adenosylcobinamide-GDP ribazoletransferase